MRDRGEVEQIARGLFRLAELPPLGEPDLLTIAKKVPQAVFCLLTALAFHRLTTQIPHAVEVALPRTARIPRLDHPPIKVFRFSPESLSAGIETHSLDGVAIRVYCREKTLADVFKYRNKVGLDIALEALRAYRSQPKQDYQAVMRFARVCRVENVIRPYLEATL
jgi:predicted transcriptional regulator of viral defense system